MKQLCAAIAIAIAPAILGGCGSASLWPFGEPAERTRAPQDATAYRCDGGRTLYVRVIENGAAAWVILPEREIRLERTGAAAATNYAYRNTLLEIKGDEAALFDGATPLLAGCRRGG
jgi:membrane-bound inhibitor of C-type lysozyme